MEGEGSVVVGVSGDYNNDGAADAADFVLWRDQRPTSEKGQNPGTVNQGDQDL
jgi:hypothetical protein